MGHDANDRRAGLSDAKRELLMRRLRGEAAGEPPAIPRVSRDGPLPLSFNQERLWFLDRLGLGAAYNMAQGLQLSGPLDVDALRQALTGVVRRHEVLRTSYTEVDGEPVQEIHPPAPFALEAEDLSAGSQASRDAEVCRRFEPLPQLLKNVKYNGGSPLKLPDVNSAIDKQRQRLGDGK